MKKILATDCDEVLVQVWPKWLEWCNENMGRVKKAEEIHWNYNLCEEFGKQAMQFWANPNLYDDLQPRHLSTVVIESLISQGWEVGVVTYAKKGHFASKCDWIRHHFPDVSFIHCTKEKGYSRCTHFLDDRNKYLNQQPEDVKLLRMFTPYIQDEGLAWENHKRFTQVYGWETVLDELTKKE